MICRFPLLSRDAVPVIGAADSIVIATDNGRSTLIVLAKSGIDRVPVIVFLVIFVSAENVDPAGKATSSFRVFKWIDPVSVHPLRENRKSPHEACISFILP